jgi:hypothetical protein
LGEKEEKVINPAVDLLPICQDLTETREWFGINLEDYLSIMGKNIPSLIVRDKVCSGI